MTYKAVIKLLNLLLSKYIIMYKRDNNEVVRGQHIAIIEALSRIIEVATDRARLKAKIKTLTNEVK